MEDSVCDLIGFQYRCRSCEGLNKKDNCGRKFTFNAWDKELLNNYPLTVRLSFPFLLSHRSGVSLDLLTKIDNDLQHGKGMAACWEMVQRAHMTRYHKMEALYLSRLNYFLLLKKYTMHTKSILIRESPSQFVNFKDPSKYNGYYGSVHLFQTLWENWYYEHIVFTDKEGNKWSRLDYMSRRLQLVDGVIWSGDVSHKVSKKTVIHATLFDGKKTKSQPLYGIFTVLNEYQQVVFQGRSGHYKTYPFSSFFK